MEPTSLRSTFQKLACSDCTKKTVCVCVRVCVRARVVNFSLHIIVHKLACFDSQLVSQVLPTSHTMVGLALGLGFGHRAGPRV